MGKPKQPKSDAKDKGSVSSKDRSPSKETKSKEAKTPDSGAATPSKRGQSQGKAGSAWPPPLNRPMMAPLLLPSDYSMDEPRRPSKIYVWEWDNVWFFPVGLLANLGHRAWHGRNVVRRPAGPGHARQTRTTRPASPSMTRLTPPKKARSRRSTGPSFFSQITTTKVKCRPS
ncbi:hypothetical protein MTO96_039155 [Rhipicephalus appendiculatus]